jgi:hypothetical protein
MAPPRPASSSAAAAALLTLSLLQSLAVPASAVICNVNYRYTQIRNASESGGCTNCPSPLANISNVCAPCSAGTYLDRWNGCLSCPVAQWSVEGSKTCASCPRGTTTLPNVIATSNMSCVACPAGYDSRYGAGNDCSPCGVDSYAPFPGMASCSQCVIQGGTYNYAWAVGGQIGGTTCGLVNGYGSPGVIVSFPASNTVMTGFYGTKIDPNNFWSDYQTGLAGVDTTVPTADGGRFTVRTDYTINAVPTFAALDSATGTVYLGSKTGEMAVIRNRTVITARNSKIPSLVSAAAVDPVRKILVIGGTSDPGFSNDLLVPTFISVYDISNTSGPVVLLARFTMSNATLKAISGSKHHGTITAFTSAALTADGRYVVLVAPKTWYNPSSFLVRLDIETYSALSIIGTTPDAASVLTVSPLSASTYGGHNIGALAAASPAVDGGRGHLYLGTTTGLLLRLDPSTLAVTTSLLPATAAGVGYGAVTSVVVGPASYPYLLVATANKVVLIVNISSDTMTTVTGLAHPSRVIFYTALAVMPVVGMSRSAVWGVISNIPTELSFMVLPDASDASTLVCAPGSVYSAATKACSACPAGSFAAAGDALCSPCPFHTYNDRTGQSACTGCAAGTERYVSGGLSQQSTACCDPSPQSGCSVCSHGSSSVPGQPCAKCAAGTYRDTYAPGPCKLCPSGTASSVAGAALASACVACPRGTFSINGSATCRPCPLRTYGNAAGLGDCLPCPAGTTTTQTGSVQCSAAPNTVVVPAPPASIGKPGSVAFDSMTGASFVAYPTNGTVVRSGGTAAFALYTGLGTPSALAFEASTGLLFVADGAAGAIWALNTRVAAPTPDQLVSGLAPAVSASDVGVVGLSLGVNRTLYALESVAASAGSRVLAFPLPAAGGSGRRLPVVTPVVVITSTGLGAGPVALLVDSAAASGERVLVGGASGVVYALPSAPGSSPTTLTTVGASTISVLALNPVSRALLVANTASGAGATVDADTTTVINSFTTSANAIAAAAFDAATGQIVVADGSAGTVNASIPCTAGGFVLPCGASCNAGQYPTPAGVCASCPVGTFSQAGDTACTPCAVSSYSASTGSPSCTLCPAGTRTLSTGSASSSECQVCPAGTYGSVAGATTCAQCPAGSVSQVSGAASAATCRLCPAGSASPAGSANCIVCPAGTFSATAGSSVCLPCAEQTNSMNDEGVSGTSLPMGATSCWSSGDSGMKGTYNTAAAAGGFFYFARNVSGLIAKVDEASLNTVATLVLSLPSEASPTCLTADAASDNLYVGIRGGLLVRISLSTFTRDTAVSLGASFAGMEVTTCSAVGGFVYATVGDSLVKVNVASTPLVVAGTLASLVDLSSRPSAPTIVLAVPDVARSILYIGSGNTLGRKVVSVSLSSFTASKTCMIPADVDFNFGQTYDTFWVAAAVHPATGYLAVVSRSRQAGQYINSWNWRDPFTYAFDVGSCSIAYGNATAYPRWVGNPSAYSSDFTNQMPNIVGFSGLWTTNANDEIVYAMGQTLHYVRVVPAALGTNLFPRALKFNTRKDEYLVDYMITTAALNPTTGRFAIASTFLEAKKLGEPALTGGNMNPPMLAPVGVSFDWTGDTPISPATVVDTTRNISYFFTGRVANSYESLIMYRAVSNGSTVVGNVGGAPRIEAVLQLPGNFVCGLPMNGYGSYTKTNYFNSYITSNYGSTPCDMVVDVGACVFDAGRDVIWCGTAHRTTVASGGISGSLEPVNQLLRIRIVNGRPAFTPATDIFPLVSGSIAAGAVQPIFHVALSPDGSTLVLNDNIQVLKVDLAAIGARGSLPLVTLPVASVPSSPAAVYCGMPLADGFTYAVGNSATVGLVVVINTATWTVDRTISMTVLRNNIGPSWAGSPPGFTPRGPCVHLGGGEIFLLSRHGYMSGTTSPHIVILKTANPSNITSVNSGVIPCNWNNAGSIASHPVQRPIIVGNNYLYTDTSCHFRGTLYPLRNVDMHYNPAGASIPSMAIPIHLVDRSPFSYATLQSPRSPYGYGHLAVRSVIPCPVDSVASTTTGECLPCPTTSYLSSSSAVSTYGACAGYAPGSGCVAGFEKPDSLDSSLASCVPCSLGRICPGYGHGRGHKCPAGTYRDIVGGRTSSDCFNCPAGTASATLGATSLADCTPCAPGTISSAAGSQNCAKCADGTHAPFPGMPACVNCPVGFFRNSTATTSAARCDVCPDGFSTTSTGSTSAAACVFSCPPGTEWVAGAPPTCAPCSDYSRMTACPGGPASSRYTCSDGLVPTADRSECGPPFSSCLPGFFLASDGLCDACPPGLACFGDAQPPTTCPPAHVPSPNATVCVVAATSCEPGQLLTNGTCGPCPPDSACPNGDATSIVCGGYGSTADGISCYADSCAGGFYLSALPVGTCLPCPHGAVCPGSQGNFTACPEDQVPDAERMQCVVPSPSPSPTSSASPSASASPSPTPLPSPSPKPSPSPTPSPSPAASYDCRPIYPIDSSSLVADFDINCGSPFTNPLWTDKTGSYSMNLTAGSLPASARTLESLRQLYRLTISSGRKLFVPVDIRPSTLPYASIELLISMSAPITNNYKYLWSTDNVAGGANATHRGRGILAYDPAGSGSYLVPATSTPTMNGQLSLPAGWCVMQSLCLVCLVCQHGNMRAFVGFGACRLDLAPVLFVGFKLTSPLLPLSLTSLFSVQGPHCRRLHARPRHGVRQRGLQPHHPQVRFREPRHRPRPPEHHGAGGVRRFLVRHELADLCELPGVVQGAECDGSGASRALARVAVCHLQQAQVDQSL